MPMLFAVSMFFLSFLPLWLCVAFLEITALVSDHTSPYTEWAVLGALAVGMAVSAVSVYRTLKREHGQNYGRYVVRTAQEDTVSTTTYLLSNALPLLAFDFTQWKGVVTFSVIFGALFLLCRLHNRYDCNICLELFGYRLYQCRLEREGFDPEKEKREDLMVLLREKSLNANDRIAIREIGGGLHLGYLVEEEKKD